MLTEFGRFEAEVAGEAVTFSLSAKPVADGSPWRNLILVPIDAVLRKRNWHISWNVEERRFAAGNDYKNLVKHLPQVARKMLEVISCE